MPGYGQLMTQRPTAGDGRPARVDDTPPPTNKGLLVVAGVLLAIPIVALMWVSSYSRENPKLGGMPFFFWYQFLWVFITAALTYCAHRIVLAARGQKAGGKPEDRRGMHPGLDREDER